MLTAIVVTVTVAKATVPARVADDFEASRLFAMPRTMAEGKV